MNNFKITKTILENINEQNDRINECVDIVNGYTTDEETRVNQELQRQENEKVRQEQYNNNENRFNEINTKITDLDFDKASKNSVSSLNNKIDNLVLNGDGTQNLEVVQSRTSEGFTFKTLDGRLRNSENMAKTGIFNIEFYDLVNRAISGGELSGSSSIRITTSTKYLIEGIDEFYLRIKNLPDKTINPNIYLHDSEGNYNNNLVTRKKTTTDLYTEYKYTNLGATYLRFLFQFTDNSDIVENDIYENVEFYFYVKDRVSLINAELNKMCYDNLGNKFNSPSETMNNIGKIVSLTKNFFDKSSSDNQVGYLTSSGNVSVNEQYKTTGLIRGLENNESYIITPRIRKFLAYDKNDKPIITTYVDGNKNNYVFTVGSEWGSVRFSYYTSEENSVMLSKGDTPLAYENYGYVFGKDVDFNEYQQTKINNIIEDKIINGNVDKLKNKILFNFGDSIAAGDGNNGKGYAELFAEKYGMVCYDFAKGGATLGETSANTKYITTQVTNALSNGITPDYILVEGGTNDISYSVPIGQKTDGYSLNSFDKSTSAGALEWILYTLKTTYPNAKIVFVSVHKMSSRGYSSQIERQGLCTDICKKWSIPIIDIFNRGNMNTFLAEYHKFTNPTDTQPNGDRTHPNELGYTTFYLPLIYETISNI